MVASWQWIPRAILQQDELRQQAEQWASRWRQLVASDWAAEQMRQLQAASGELGARYQRTLATGWNAALGHRLGLEMPGGAEPQTLPGRVLSGQYSLTIPETLERSQQQIQQSWQDVRQYVKENPLRSPLEWPGHFANVAGRAGLATLSTVGGLANAAQEGVVATGRAAIGKAEEALGAEPGQPELMPYRTLPGEATFEQRTPPGAKLAYEFATGLALPNIDPLAAIVGKAGKSIQSGTEALGLVSRPATGNRAVDVLVDMYSQVPQQARTSQVSAAEEARRSFVRAWTDSGVDTSEMQKAVAKRTGGVLSADEQMAELARLDPSKAAEVRVQALRPALQSIGDDRPYLSTYLTLVHDEDVAKAVGQRAETAVLATPLKPTLAEKAVRSGNARLRMFQRLRGQAQAAGDAARVASYDAQIAATQTAIQRAQRRALRQVTAADAARQAAAQQAGATAEAARQFSGGRVASESAPAIAVLQQVLGPERFGRIQQAAQQVWDFNRELLEERLRAGLISQELYDSLVQMYPHYSPTVILDYLDTEAARIARGSSISVSTNGIKRLTEEGTVRAREDPLVSTLRNAYQTEAAVKKNRVFNAFASLWERDPELQRQIEKVAVGASHTVQEKPVTGFVGGQKVEFMVPNYLRQAIEAEPRAAIPFFGPITAAWRQLVTSKNPAFLTANAFADTGTYMLREMSRGGGPQAAPRALLELVKAYGDAFSGIFQGEYRKGLADFLRAGGGMGGYTQVTPKTGAAALDALTRQSALEVRNVGDLFRILRDVITLRPIEAISERIEQAPRVASFRLAQRRGANLVDAVIAGRTVTLDFQQGGNWAKVLNQLIPFFNVGTQAAAAPVRTIRENPRGAALTALTALVAPTLAAEAWNRSDPERAQDYADVPQYLKDQGLVIMIPGYAPVDAQGNRHPQFLHLRTREFAPFMVATREIARHVIGDQPRGWDDLLGGIAQSISPVGGLDIPLVGGPLVEVPFELQQNRDIFRKRAIETERSNREASPFAQTIGSALGQSPAKVEFAIREAGGGPGQMLLEASEALAGRINQRAAGPSGVPVVGQLAKRFVRGDIGEQLERGREQRLSPTVEQALKAAGVTYTPAPTAGAIGAVPLTVQEQAEYQRLTNQYVEQALTWQIGQPAWERATPEQREARIRQLVDQAREKAKAEMKAKIGDDEARRRLQRTGAGG